MNIDKEKLQKIKEKFYSKAEYKKVVYDVVPMSLPVDKIYYMKLYNNGEQNEQNL